MKAIINGKVLLENGEFRNLALLFDRKIRALCSREEALAGAEEVIDASGAYVSPGFVDLHVHGYMGIDVSDGEMEGIRTMAAELVKNGVTAFLPTTMTLPWAQLEKVFDHLRLLKTESERADFNGAQILGGHAEGPFISPEKKGAQDGGAILPPDADRVLPYRDILRVMTYAPERPGAAAFARKILRESGIVLSIGHTAADFKTCMEALGLGVDHFTHTFNAMSPMHHREPGTVGAALCSDAYTELIADTFHVHPALFPLLMKAKGDRLCLITDCLPAGGLPDGEYTLGGRAFSLRGIQCRLPDGTIAGSVLRMNEAVRNLRDYASVPVWEAVRAASLVPARAIRADREKGSLKVGKDADIVLMDRDMRVVETYVRGRRVYRAGENNGGKD